MRTKILKMALFQGIMRTKVLKRALSQGIMRTKVFETGVLPKRFVHMIPREMTSVKNNSIYKALDGLIDEKYR
jgi:hypothetical protein